MKTIMSTLIVLGSIAALAAPVAAESSRSFFDRQDRARYATDSKSFFDTQDNARYAADARTLFDGLTRDGR